MIEKLITQLQISLNLDKEGLVFADQKNNISLKNEGPVFKADNFIVISEMHASFKHSISPIISFNLSDLDEAVSYGRKRLQQRENTTKITFKKIKYEISEGFSMIIDNIKLLDAKGYLIVVCEENDLIEQNNNLLEDYLSNKGFSVNAVIGLPPSKSRVRRRNSLYIISKHHENLFIADILEKESNSNEVIENFIISIESTQKFKNQGDIESGYSIKKTNFISLYNERSKSRIEKITAFDKGFQICALQEIIASVSTNRISADFLKIGILENSLFIKNIDFNNDNFQDVDTEESWVKSIATLGPLKEDYDHHKYFYISVDKRKVKAEYLVIFLQSYLGRELYKLTPKSQSRMKNRYGKTLAYRMTTEDLFQLQVYYPNLKTQDDIIEANSKLNKLQDSLNEFSEGLSSNPNKLIGESSDQIQQLLGIVGKLNSAERIRNHIRKIETGYSEFKETWRFPVDFEGNKIKKDFEKRAENMTPDIFKVINSFLNSYGGDLMIGINDRSHEARGIEKEIDHYWGYKKSEHYACLEKFENEFKKTLKSCIDLKFIGEEKNIFWEFVPYDGFTVFLIRCRQSSIRSYLKHESEIRSKLGHSFYHRLGNDSEPMDSDEDRDKYWSQRTNKPNQV